MIGVALLWFAVGIIAGLWFISFCFIRVFRNQDKAKAYINYLIGTNPDGMADNILDSSLFRASLTRRFGVEPIDAFYRMVRTVREYERFHTASKEERYP